jgi:hypothetical protein
MTSKAKATPSKAKASSDIDLSLAKEFRAVIGGSLEGEAKAFWKLHSQVAQGILSVRGAMLTVKEAELEGALPSFRSSWCEHILTVGVLAKVEGGQFATLKRLFAVSVQGRKAFGAEEFNAMIKDAPSIEALEASIPSQAERGAGKKVASEKDKAKPVTLADLIAQLGGALKGGAKIDDTKKARLLVKELQKAITQAEAVQGVKAVTRQAA